MPRLMKSTSNADPALARKGGGYVDPREPLPLVANRQHANSDTGLLEDNHAPAFKGFADGRQVRKQEGHLLFMPPLRSTTKKDE